MCRGSAVEAAEASLSLGCISAKVGGGKKLRDDLLMKEVFDDRVGDTESGSILGAARKEVAVSSRLPEEFIVETLIPHMDRLISRYIVAHTPAMLTQLVTAYATYTDYRKSGQNTGPIIERLMDTIKYRMAGYSASDIVSSLPSCLLLAADDTELFEMFADRIQELKSDFSALNLLGIVRVYSKLGKSFLKPVHEWMVPALVEVIQSYDNQELTDIFISLANASSTDASLSGDVHALFALVPEMERRLLRDLPFFMQSDILWAMIKLGVNHSALIESVAVGINKPGVAEDSPLRQIARLYWVFSKAGKLDSVNQVLGKTLQEGRNHLSPADLARVAQALPAEGGGLPIGLLESVADRLVKELIVEEKNWLTNSGDSKDKFPASMKRDLLFLLTAQSRLKTLQLAPSGELFSLLLRHADSFTDSDIRRITAALLSAPDSYGRLVAALPKDWRLIVRAVTKQMRLQQPHEHTTECNSDCQTTHV